MIRTALWMPAASPIAAAMEIRWAWWVKKLVALARDLPYLVPSLACFSHVRAAAAKILNRVREEVATRNAMHARGA